MTRVIIEEFAHEHEDLRHPGTPPLCQCEDGRAFEGSDSCIYCGRYIEELFSPIVTPLEADFADWNRFIRERPYSEES